MVYFISDLHFGHSNIIRLCNRPYDSIEQMDAALISGWNGRVHKNDTVYIIGDAVWDKKRVAYYMEQLNGKKVLITGNHDSTWSRREECRLLFELVTPYLEISLEGHPITMCHYPMLEWTGSREERKRGLGYHIHGHIHNRVFEEYRPLYLRHNALNAGVDVNGFVPVTFDELVENNLHFKLSALNSDEDRARLLSAYKAE